LDICLIELIQLGAELDIPWVKLDILEVEFVLFEVYADMLLVELVVLRVKLPENGEFNNIKIISIPE
jgi:hypothetical protein